MKFYLRSGVSLILFPLYLIVYRITRINTVTSHLSMLYCFLITNGYYNDLIIKIKSIIFPYYDYSGQETVASTADVNEMVSTLKNDGYFVIKDAIPEEIIRNIKRSIKKIKAIPRRTDKGSDIEKSFFNSRNIKAVRYDYDTSDVLDIPAVQDLLASPLLLNVAGKYLGTMPAADIVGIWWNTKFGDKPDSNAAQYFHYDLDRLKWLKVFIYLTDVGPDNGPHEFVRGSHRSGTMPLKIRKKLYSRISDDDIKDVYGSENLITMTGKKGTIIFEDTRGFHKGNKVNADPRLVLQFQFSASLFGAVYPSSKISEIKSKKLGSMLKTGHKHILREYL